MCIAVKFVIMMNTTLLYSLFIPLILLIIILILALVTRNIYIILLLGILILIFLPNIVVASQTTYNLARVVITKNYDLSRNLIDTVFAKWNTLKVVGIKPNRNVMYLVKYPDSPIEYLAFKYFEPVSLLSKDRGLVNSKIDLGFVNPDNRILLPNDDKGYYDKTKEMIAHKIKSMSIYAYPESNPINGRLPDVVHPLRTGLFRIAKELNIPVVPVVIENIKRDYILQQRNQHIYIGQMISPYLKLDEMVSLTTKFMEDHIKLSKN